eukprot:1145381-Pelagomonas_calceolata.AAC.9
MASYQQCHQCCPQTYGVNCMRGIVFHGGKDHHLWSERADKCNNVSWGCIPAACSLLVPVQVNADNVPRVLKVLPKVGSRRCCALGSCTKWQSMPD